MRNSFKTCFIVSILSTFLIGFCAASDADATRAKIAKSLSLLQKTATSYTQQRRCFSCHHQALPVMTFDLARKKGFEISKGTIRHQSDFTIAHFKPKIATIKKGVGIGGASFTAGHVLVALHIDSWPRDETTNALVKYLTKKQKKDGRWRIVSKRPPMENNDFTSTALSLRGLQLYGKKDEVQQLLARARSWLINHPAESNEAMTYRLFGLKWVGAEKKHLQRAVSDLLETQRPDGGWGQIPSMKSDAYATGQALVSLHEAGGVETTDAAFRKGIAFLRKSQRDDGSWLVKTRSRPIQTYFESGFPHGKDQFISTAATCWATMAILHSLPDQESNASHQK